MTRNPIRKVLSTLRSYRVRHLLMGGQACVFYGAAEFSRDADIAILADLANLRRLENALKALQAVCIAVPPLRLSYLKKGHAIHFRCHHPEATGIRIDVMSVMRGVPPFPTLWRRRITIEMSSGEQYDLMALPDLVRAKKTQRDKDWPMVRRLVEAHYVENARDPMPRQVAFWFSEARTPSLLIQLARQYPAVWKQSIKKRPALAFALEAHEKELLEALLEEELREREVDRLYWAPLRKELERLRYQAVTRRKRRRS